MQALYQEILPPSGVEFGTTLKLTPSTLPPSPSTPTPQDQPSRGALYNIVVARGNILRVFEVKDDPAPISSQLEDERQRWAEVRRGTEAVEGEVEMDRQGEGFVNMGSVKVILDTSLSMSTTLAMTDICHHSIFETPGSLEQLS
jgi:cleavage and polyadenylation specificity factor subunit 1